MYDKELRRTYNYIKSKKLNFQIEDFEVAELVHKYRMYWKPEKLKTLLLAESHVFTDSNLIKQNYTINELEDYPENFVRFVYCLAYGENNLIPEYSDKSNTGTPQFWKLFNECCSNKYKVVNNKNPKNKIQEKLSLLNEMKNEGFWLLDCSIVGIYNNGEKPNKKDYNEILKTSYIGYCLPIIKSLNPDKIIIVGKSVYDLIINEIDEQQRNKYNWIHQPNARVKNIDRRTISNIDK